jgi:hypothetical protein
MTCKSGTKATPIHHFVALSEPDCTLHNGRIATLNHSFKSPTTEPWKVHVKTQSTAEEGVRFPHGNPDKTVDEFDSTPAPANDYVIVMLRSETTDVDRRQIEFLRNHRPQGGNGASVRVFDTWSLGARTQNGSFRLNFKVAD